MGATDCDIAIVGAGPYGLAAAAHLQAADGLEIRVFGEAMSFWEQHMPEGMLLRSPYVACNIADPDRELTLDRFQAEGRVSLPRPLGLGRFVEYGRWFQRRASIPTDQRDVTGVEQNGNFRVELSDGSAVSARHVVVAAGVKPFAWTPPAFAKLPSALASHSSEHRSFSGFGGRRVAVVGGGQSALESAALLHEAGAEVEVLVRGPRVYFLRRVPWLHRLGPVTRLLFAPAEVGPAGISRLVSAPSWYRRLPRGVQDRFSVRALRPAGAAWLIPRLEHVPIRLATSVVEAREVGDGLELTLGDGSHRSYDHALLATGYRVDIAGYRFLPAKLLEQIDRVQGYPRLSACFASSVPGLYFLGAAAAWSFGPLMRFVAGTEFASPRLTDAILVGSGRRR
jgi:hypothetical protein